MRFFFDNNLSPKLAKCLDVLVQPDHSVVHLKDLFPADTPDSVWLEALAGERDWVIVSGDVRISKNPIEVEAWKRAGHTTFFIGALMNLLFWEQAHKMVRCFPTMLKQAQDARPGTTFVVSPNCKIR